MERFMVFIILLVFFACSKEKCFDCTQKIKLTSNKPIKGYPAEYNVKFVSCGDNTNIVDNPTPIIFNDTIGDTVYTYWKDTDCVKKKGLF